MVDILRIIGALINVYMLLIFVYVLLLWFDRLRLGNAGRYLGLITEPYLGLFRSLTFLRKGAMDFTPLVAIMLLSFLSSLVNTLADSLSSGMPLSFRLILVILLKFVWDTVILGILLFILIICIIRALSLSFSKNPMSGGWSMMDTFIGPIVSKVEKSVEKLMHRSVGYTHALLVTAGLIIVVIFLGSLIFSQLTYAAAALPV